MEVRKQQVFTCHKAVGKTSLMDSTEKVVGSIFMLTRRDSFSDIYAHMDHSGKYQLYF